MKKQLIFTVSFLMIIYACKKDDFSTELDISYSSLSLKTDSTSKSVFIEPITYPNPFKDSLFVRVTSFNNNSIEIYIFDESGVSKSFNRVSNYFVLDFSKSTRGAYTCLIKHDGKVFKNTVIKK